MVGQRGGGEARAHIEQQVAGEDAVATLAVAERVVEIDADHGRPLSWLPRPGRQPILLEKVNQTEIFDDPERGEGFLQQVADRVEVHRRGRGIRGDDAVMGVLGQGDGRLVEALLALQHRLGIGDIGAQGKLMPVMAEFISWLALPTSAGLAGTD